jgi:hypothetical protein
MEAAPSRQLRPAALALAALLTVSLAASLAAAAPPRISVSWSSKLAHADHRAGYQKLLLRQVNAAYHAVRRGFGFDLPALQIRLYAPADYVPRFGKSGAQYYRHPRWRHGVVRVNGGARLNLRFTGTLVHEMVHAFVDVRGTIGWLPVWFSEGVAELYRWRFSGMKGLSASQSSDLKSALEAGKLLPLPRRASLSHFNYLRSYAAVLYLERAYGGKTVGALLSRMMARQSAEASFEAVVGGSVGDFEKRFAAWVSTFP